MTNEAPLVGRWVDPVPFLPAAAPDQFAETLPSAHGVAELFNFIVLLQLQSSDLLWKKRRNGLQ